MNVPQDRGDYSSLNDRMGYLFAIRIAVAVVTVVYGAARPEALGVPFSTVLSVAGAYALVSVIFEIARRRTTRCAGPRLREAPSRTNREDVLEGATMHDRFR